MIPLISPYDVLCAGKWDAALLTTFSLSLSFFEAVPLHALRKAGTQDIGIVTDVTGYQASLAEAGVSDVGRTYDLVPLKVTSGCFHPKIMLLNGPDGLRATVGSGNLTFGGWGHNIETLDLLVPSQAPKAFTDLADFLDYLALSFDEGSIAVPACPSIIGSMAEACRKAGRGGGDGKTRLIHSFDGPIVTQLASHAAALGGTEEITVVSPYFGGPEAVFALSEALACSQVRVALTGRAPEFFDFAAAKSLGMRASPVRSDDFSSTALLHAKIIDLTCRNGRIVLSGSANATRPALVTSNNVEASVLRITDDRLTFGWCATDPRNLSDGEGGNPDPVGGPCLSARFDGAAIKGRLFGQKAPAGAWIARIVSGAVHATLAPVTVDTDGAFEIRPASTLPFHNLLRSTQLVLARDAAEIRGWVVFDQILGAVRERGPVAEAMIRALAGSEEPDDIAVILSFFAANPCAFLEETVGTPETNTASGRTLDMAGASVELADLRPTIAFVDEIAKETPTGTTAFERLLVSMRRYVREAPLPVRALADASDMDDASSGNAGALPRWRIDQVIEVLAEFVEEIPTETNDFRRHAVSFLDFVLFAAERSEEPDELKADYVRRWIGIVRAARAAQDEPDVLDRAFVAVLASRVISDPSKAKDVHTRLQRWCNGSLDPIWVEAVTPSSAGIRERRLDGKAWDDDWNEAMRRTISTRTPWMDVNEVQRAIAGLSPMPQLPVALAPEAAVLRQVAAGKAKPQRIITLTYRSTKPACPKCYLTLPILAREQLREHRMALMPCCDRVLLDPLME